MADKTKCSGSAANLFVLGTQDDISVTRLTSSIIYVYKHYPNLLFLSGDNMVWYTALVFDDNMYYFQTLVDIGCDYTLSPGADTET